jgi:hypothetical protein
MVDETAGGPRRRLFGRTRRENVEGGRVGRHEVKVTAEEEAELQRLAGEQNIGVVRLLVESALASSRDSSPSQEREERRELLAELFAIHRLLGSIARNVNQVTRAINATREAQPELASTLDSVRRIGQRIDAAVDGLDHGSQWLAELSAARAVLESAEPTSDTRRALEAVRVCADRMTRIAEGVA